VGATPTPTAVAHASAEPTDHAHVGATPAGTSASHVGPTPTAVAHATPTPHSHVGATPTPTAVARASAEPTPLASHADGATADDLAMAPLGADIASTGALRTRDGGKGDVGTVDVDPAGRGEMKVASAGKVEVPLEDRLLAGRPAVEGKLDPQQVLDVIQAHEDSFRHCYETELQRNARLSGKVVLSWSIAEDGAVEETGIESTSLHDATVEACLKARLRPLQFPPPDGGRVRVQFPFVFEAAPGESS
jgi:hypothetical protein